MTATLNLARWRKAWTDRKTGKRKRGFWYFCHNGKRVSLTKYGAPTRKTRSYQAAKKARDRFLAELH